jgi:hypothetical protein
MQEKTTWEKKLEKIIEGLNRKKRVFIHFRNTAQKTLYAYLIKSLRSIPVFYLVGKKRPGRLSA